MNGYDCGKPAFIVSVNAGEVVPAVMLSPNARYRVRAIVGGSVGDGLGRALGGGADGGKEPTDGDGDGDSGAVGDGPPHPIAKAMPSSATTTNFPTTGFRQVQ